MKWAKQLVGEGKPAEYRKRWAFPTDVTNQHWSRRLWRHTKMTLLKRAENEPCLGDHLMTSTRPRSGHSMGEGCVSSRYTMYRIWVGEWPVENWYFNTSNYCNRAQKFEQTFRYLTKLIKDCLRYVSPLTLFISFKKIDVHKMESFSQLRCFHSSCDVNWKE